MKNLLFWRKVYKTYISFFLCGSKNLHILDCKQLHSVIFTYNILPIPYDSVKKHLILSYGGSISQLVISHTNQSER